MDPWIVVPMLAVIAVVFVILPVGGAVFTHFRRRKLVRCPATDGDAIIRVNAVQAAVAESIRGSGLTIAECSFWPKRRSCDQACLRGTPWLMRDAPRAT